MRKILFVTIFFLSSFTIPLIGQEYPMDFNETMLNIRGILVESNEQQTAAMGRSQKKLDEGLKNFMKTPFMMKYRELKLDAESLAGTFKALAQNFDPKEVGRVRKAYNVIANKFNAQLLEIKEDFMDRKKLKVIRQNPEMYSNSLQFKLRELKDEYSQTFEKVVAEVSGNDSYSAVPLAAIFSLIKLSIDFTNYLASTNYASRQLKDEHLQRYLLEPYRFLTWDEIPTGEGDSFNTNSSDGNEYSEESYAEPIETTEPDTTTFGSRNIKTMNPFPDKKTKKKENKKNN